jgi:ADP-ribose pyrophosphatase
MELALDEGETPFTCARRELEEETGYLADEWHNLGGWLIDPNRTEARFHYYLALGARSDGQRHLDATEDIVVHRVPLAEVQSVFTAGQVQSLASWAGIMAGMSALQSMGASGSSEG